LFKVDLLGVAKDVWQYNAETVYNEITNNTNDFEVFNCIDYSSYGMNKTANKVLDIGTNFVPLVG